MADIAQQLREHASSGHVRGCQGRCYTCDCGYDIKSEGLLELAADEIERLRAAVDIALEAFRQIDRKSAEYLLALNAPKQPGAT